MRDAPGVPTTSGRRRSRLSVIGVLVIVSFALAACASSSGATWTYAPTPPSTPAPSVSASASGGAGGSAGPSASAGGSPGSSPATSGAPGASNPAASGGGTGTTLSLTAQNIAYDKQTLSAPANLPFTIAFSNQDQGIPHNVSVHRGSPTGSEIFKGDIITGPAQTSYTIPALAPGVYGFVCSVHPNMTGTLNVQ